MTWMISLRGLCRCIRIGFNNMKNKAKILVIIVTWNKKDYVLDLLASIADIDYPNKLLDILVVDNASEDGTVDAVRQQFKDVQIIQNDRNLGGTGGFNTGLAKAFEQKASKYDYLWLLDNDVQVHRNTLTELVSVLTENPDAAVCGSTMMQLDYPWRINEMGAFVDRATCSLQLNRHMEEISSWKSKKLKKLLSDDVDLSELLLYCQPTMDVDYVAAASLLIRSSVAREAGLWMDFFIHFDDVEWCLRIAKMGHRIMVSARSLIWHVSAISKVPTWILYYDNRNILYLLSEHNPNDKVIKNARRLSLKKGLYYQLLGKQDLADLHIQAVADFSAGKMGKQEIALSDPFRPLEEMRVLLANPEVKRVLLPWTVNLQASSMQKEITKAVKQRDDLQVYCLIFPYEKEIQPHFQVPGAIPVSLSRSLVLRLFDYWKMRGRFDIVIQSDYQAVLPLSWLSNTIIFVNYENLTVRKRPSFKSIPEFVLNMLKYW